MGELKSPRPHDKNGIPVYAGDLIRTPHYKHHRNRRLVCLHHVAVEQDGSLFGVPARDLALPHDGGKFLLTDGNLCQSEIIQGTGPEHLMEFFERPRRQCSGKGIERNESSPEQENQQ